LYVFKKIYIFFINFYTTLEKNKNKIPCGKSNRFLFSRVISKGMTHKKSLLTTFYSEFNVINIKVD